MNLLPGVDGQLGTETSGKVFALVHQNADRAEETPFADMEHDPIEFCVVVVFARWRWLVSDSVCCRHGARLPGLLIHNVHHQINAQPENLALRMVAVHDI